MMKQIMKNKKGFTLIEIIVVLVIMGILLAISIPAILGYVDKAQDAKYMAAGRSLSTEVTVYAEEYMLKNKDEDFKTTLAKFKGKFAGSLTPPSPNYKNPFPDIKFPDGFEVKSIDLEFDGKTTSGGWNYDDKKNSHSISKLSFALYNKKNEFKFVVIMVNKNVYVYDQEDAQKAIMDKIPEAPIFVIDIKD